MAKRSLQGRRRGEIIYQRLIVFVLLVAFIILARAVYGLWQKNELAKKNLSAATVQLDKLMARKIMLEDKIERLKTQRGLEEEIRANFAVVKPGEKVINIIDDKKSTTATATLIDRPWWQIW